MECRSKIERRSKMECITSSQILLVWWPSIASVTFCSWNALLVESASYTRSMITERACSLMTSDAEQYWSKRSNLSTWETKTLRTNTIMCQLILQGGIEHEVVTSKPYRKRGNLWYRFRYACNQVKSFPMENMYITPWLLRSTLQMMQLFHNVLQRNHQSPNVWGSKDAATRHRWYIGVIQHTRPWSAPEYLHCNEICHRYVF